MSKSKRESKKTNINMSRIIESLSFLKWKAWYSTILFFIVLLVVSVWVWWNCFYDPQPSNQVIIEIQGNQRDYDAMKTGIENTMETLKERQDRFNDSSSFSSQRELFLDPSQQKDLLETESAEPVGDQNVLEDGDSNVPEEPKEPKEPKEPEEPVDQAI